jgi:hypothetical protein
MLPTLEICGGCEDFQHLQLYKIQASWIVNFTMHLKLTICMFSQQFCIHKSFQYAQVIQAWKEKKIGYECDVKGEFLSKITSPLFDDVSSVHVLSGQLQQFQGDISQF